MPPPRLGTHSLIVFRAKHSFLVFAFFSTPRKNSGIKVTIDEVIHFS